MPGHGPFRVKCEPPSDEEDNSPQIPEIFLNYKLTSEYLSVKVERNVQNDERTPSDLLQHLETSGLEELAPLAPAGPAATPVCVKEEPGETALTLETLQSAPHSASCSRALLSSEELDSSSFTPLQLIKDEPWSEELQHVSSDEAAGAGETTGVGGGEAVPRGSPKSWTQRDMDSALDALKNHNMSLTKASAMYGIPSTTLWQRAHRLGIDTPKKEGGAKSWSEADLRGALHALRAGAISANKASKAYGIPSSTLYKIARREGIRLAAPFNAAPVSWRRGDLARALAAIRAGAASVQRAAAQYGIPTGTLYGRCKREGIELSRSNPTPWSEDAMGEALEAVRVGQMSINQAAIHYNLPYSSLYGRFKRCKYFTQPPQIPQQEIPKTSEMGSNQQDVPYYQQLPHMHAEQDHAVAQTQYTRHEYVESTATPNMTVQDPYTAAPHMYYNQSYNSVNSVVTS